jgi:hypothetical protein
MTIFSHAHSISIGCDNGDLDGATRNPKVNEMHRSAFVVIGGNVTGLEHVIPTSTAISAGWITGRTLVLTCF